MERIHLEEARALLEEARGLRFTARRVHLAHRVTSLIRNTSESSSDLLSDEHDELKRNYRAIQEENLKLQAVITDVTEVNKRWQRYNNDRQMYVDKLLTTIKEQQEQINKIGEEKFVGVNKQNKDGDDCQAVRRENLSLREQVRQLKDQLEEKEREGAALRLQAQVHRDDWEAERSEKVAALRQRELAEKRCEELTKDLRTLKLKLREERLHALTLCPNCGRTLPPMREALPAPPAGEPCRKAASDTLIPRGCYSSSSDDMYLTCDKASDEKPATGRQNDGNSESSNLPSPSSRTSPDTTVSEPESRLMDNSSPCTSFSVVSGEGAVTLGFSSSGLASITSFPVSVFSPPVCASTGSSVSEKKDVQSNISSASSIPSRKPSPVRRLSEEQDDGVATQTRVDIICPGCGVVFPPGRNIDFLDHFELCQEQEISTQSKSEIEDSDIMKCPKCALSFPAHNQRHFLDHFDQCQWPENKKFSGEMGKYYLSR